jgi:hypothetical protein
MQGWLSTTPVEEMADQMYRRGYALEQIAETLQIPLRRLKVILREED